jgi:hypothetical protein
MQDSASVAGLEPDPHHAVQTQIEQLRRERLQLIRRRNTVAVLWALALLLAFALAGILKNPGQDLHFQLLWMLESPTGETLLMIALVPAVLSVLRLSQREQDVRGEIELLQAKDKVDAVLGNTNSAANLLGQPPSYFDRLVRINVDNLSEYYALVKVHTNNSFRASLGSGAVGFLLIVAGVLASFGGAERSTPATLAAISGLITEFIAGVFFFLYNKTVRQLKDYHDSLLAVQNILLALKLVNESDDPEGKKEMTAQMCKALLSHFPTRADRSGGIATPKLTPETAAAQ